MLNYIYNFFGYNQESKDEQLDVKNDENSWDIIQSQKQTISLEENKKNSEIIKKLKIKNEKKRNEWIEYAKRENKIVLLKIKENKMAQESYLKKYKNTSKKNNIFKIIQQPKKKTS
jgi:hypothetical protein